LAGPKSATQVESHSLHPIRIVGPGGVLDGQPSKERVRHSARLARLHAASSDGIYEPQSFGSPQHEAATDAWRREGNGRSRPLFACMAFPFAGAKDGPSHPKSSIAKLRLAIEDRGGPMQPDRDQACWGTRAQFEEAANPSPANLALADAVESPPPRRPALPTAPLMVDGTSVGSALTSVRDGCGGQAGAASEGPMKKKCARPPRSLARQPVRRLCKQDDRPLDLAFRDPMSSMCNYPFMRLLIADSAALPCPVAQTAIPRSAATSGERPLVTDPVRKVPGPKWSPILVRGS
jgi:hypothetical protein